MSNEDNLAHEADGKPPAPAQSGGGAADTDTGAARGKRRDIADYNFESPDEESMQFIEGQWRRFCRSIGLEGEIPDIRATFAAERTDPPPMAAPSRRFVRPFAAVYRWLNGLPDLEQS